MSSRREGPNAVVAAGVGMVVLHGFFRAWALFGGWFYGDDFRLMHEGRANGTSIEALAAPYDFQFMPLGRLIAWWVSSSQEAEWSRAAFIVLVLSVAAGASCAWMLLTLFGRRWSAVALLAIYLSSALTLPATMWFAAAVNQIPWQIAFFLAVGSWVQHLRTRRWTWAVATLVALTFGLLAYIKALLIFLVLASLLVGWFVSGNVRERLRALLTRWSPQVAMLAVPAMAAVVGYRWWVPQPFEKQPELGTSLDLVGTMVGRSLATGLLGGPWSWVADNPPVARAVPTELVVIVSWLLLVSAIGYMTAHRTRVGRALLLLVAYAGIAAGLVATSRGVVVGPIAGTELRYLTDVLPVAVLALGLATSELLGAPGSSSPRAEAWIRWRAKPPVIAAATTAVVCGGIVSSTLYAHVWHTNHPGADYLKTAIAEGDQYGEVDLPAGDVPDRVMARLLHPANRFEYLLPVVSEVYRFPEATDRLAVLDDSGAPRAALIETEAVSAPGPVPGCGWRVAADGARIDLSSVAPDGDHWVRIGYLASDDSPIRVTAGGTQLETEIRAGVRSLYLHLPGAFDHVDLAGIDPGTTMCVDTIEVGQPVPGGEL